MDDSFATVTTNDDLCKNRGHVSIILTVWHRCLTTRIPSSENLVDHAKQAPRQFVQLLKIISPNTKRHHTTWNDDRRAVLRRPTIFAARSMTPPPPQRARHTQS